MIPSILAQLQQTVPVESMRFSWSPEEVDPNDPQHIYMSELALRIHNLQPCSEIIERIIDKDRDPDNQLFGYLMFIYKESPDVIPLHMEVMDEARAKLCSAFGPVPAINSEDEQVYVLRVNVFK